jgi:hypothetical protein
MMGLRARTAEMRARAEEMLRLFGARRVWVQETRAG